jgi:hypothetical protein
MKADYIEMTTHEKGVVSHLADLIYDDLGLSKSDKTRGMFIAGFFRCLRKSGLIYKISPWRLDVGCENKAVDLGKIEGYLSKISDELRGL